MQVTGCRGKQGRHAADAERDHGRYKGGRRDWRTKANPGKVNMASGGVGSPPHLYRERFKMMARVYFRPRSSNIAGLVGVGTVQYE
jgi:hypothetical protein